MPERDLDARLDAVERALTDGDTDLSGLQESADVVDDVRDLESRFAELESRIDELEAGLQAVRGYAGNVRAVNREVERRASAALAKAETLETAVDDDGGRSTAQSSRSQSRDGANQGLDDWRRSDESGPRASVATESAPHESASHKSAPHESAPHESAPPASNSKGAESPRPSRQGPSEGSRGDRRQPDRDSTVTGPEGRATGGRSGRVSGEDDPANGSESTADSDGSQTEQFIERVRDAL